MVNDYCLVNREFLRTVQSCIYWRLRALKDFNKDIGVHVDVIKARKQYDNMYGLWELTKLALELPSMPCETLDTIHSIIGGKLLTKEKPPIGQLSSLCIENDKIKATRYLLENYRTNVNDLCLYSSDCIEGRALLTSIRRNQLSLVRWLSECHSINFLESLGVHTLLTYAACCVSDTRLLEFMLNHNKVESDAHKIDALSTALVRQPISDKVVLFLLSKVKKASLLFRIVKDVPDQAPETIFSEIYNKLKPQIRDLLPNIKSAKFMRYILRQETIGQKYLNKVLSNMDINHVLNLDLALALIEHGGDVNQIRFKPHKGRILEAMGKIKGHATY